MKEKFLPVGTVVILKGGKKRLMVTGFCMLDKNNNNKMYDYSGCLYPEGMVSSDQTALFDHSQIEKIFYMGLVDEEEKLFKAKLKEALNQQNKNANTTNETKKEDDFDPDKVPPIGPGLDGEQAA